MTARSARLWIVLAVLAVLGAVLVGSLSGRPGRALDPSSTEPDGSRALARVLEHYGAAVTRTESAGAVATGAVVVTDPGAYSAVQLAALAGAATRVVLVAPDVRALRAVDRPQIEPDSSITTAGEPGCGEPAAQAAGRVDLEVTGGYTGASVSCYGGLAVLSGKVVVLASGDLFRNDRLARDGVAALDVNLITADRTLHAVRWLLPGSDAAGGGALSIWDLFPPGAYRAFAWTLLVVVLVVVWRARRLGAVVTEPLPVVVRSAESVEGHGRLYLRAGARDRAAAALRSGTLDRLRARLALRRTAGARDVAAATGSDPALLGGGVPHDDAGLLRLAAELDALERQVEGTRRG